MESTVEHRWPADPDVNLETWRERRGRDEAKGRLYESSTIMLRKAMRGDKCSPRRSSKAGDTCSDQNLERKLHCDGEHVVISGQLMRFRILGQKWAGRAKRATTKQVQDRTETTNVRGLSKRANKR